MIKTYLIQVLFPLLCVSGPGEESDGEYFRDSSSDGSSDSEQERGGLNNSRQQLSFLQASDGSLRVDKLSLRGQHMTFQEGFSSDEGESGSSHGSLLFEYLERDPPYCREPLANKVTFLFHPELLIKFCPKISLVHYN